MDQVRPAADGSALPAPYSAPPLCFQDHCKKGEALLARLEHWDNVSSADPGICGVKVHSFWARLQDFSQRVKSTGNSIDRAVQLYRFLDEVRQTSRWF